MIGISLNTNQRSYAFSDQVIQQGATGEDVIELQARLQYIGFYHGQIDGVFGWGTYWALRNFQDEFDMKVDGYAGEQAKNMLEDRTEYHKGFVREHLEAGRYFTHYGGMNLDHQVRYDSPKKQKQEQEQADQKEPQKAKSDEQSKQQTEIEQQDPQTEQQSPPIEEQAPAQEVGGLKMRRWISITVLSIALAFTGYWGYQQFTDKELLMVQAENNYQRSFHDLTYHVDLLYDKIGTTLALKTKNTLSPQMLDIWQLTAQAQSDVSQLPLGLLPFTKTETFLADIGEFTYHVAIRDLDNKPLNEEEIGRLVQLYESANEIRKELRTVQHKVFSDQLKWVEVELALANNDRETPNHIIDSFTAVEDFTTGFDQSHFDNLSADFPSQQERFQFVSGDPINEADVENLIMRQFDLSEDLDIDLQKSGEGAQLDTYSGSFSHEDQHLAIIEDKAGTEVLTYAFFGTLNHDTYQIFIDSNTGDEVFVQLMHDVESKWD